MSILLVGFLPPESPKPTAGFEVVGLSGMSVGILAEVVPNDRCEVGGDYLRALLVANQFQIVLPGAFALCFLEGICNFDARIVFEVGTESFGLRKWRGLTSGF